MQGSERATSGLPNRGATAHLHYEATDDSATGSLRGAS